MSGFNYSTPITMSSIDVTFITKEGSTNYTADVFNKLSYGLTDLMKFQNPAWTVNSFVTFFNCLYNYVSEGTTANFSIDIGETNLATLTDEQKMIPIMKGWNLTGYTVTTVMLVQIYQH